MREKTCQKDKLRPICGFDCTREGKYFGGESVSSTKVDMGEEKSRMTKQWLKMKLW